MLPIGYYDTTYIFNPCWHIYIPSWQGTKYNTTQTLFLVQSYFQYDTTPIIFLMQSQSGFLCLLHLIFLLHQKHYCRVKFSDTQLKFADSVVPPFSHNSHRLTMSSFSQSTKPIMLRLTKPMQWLPSWTLGIIDTLHQSQMTLMQWLSSWLGCCTANNQKAGVLVQFLQMYSKA